MRIRKRFPPSSLSSVALSDPQVNRSPLVQHHHLPSSTQVYPDGNLGVQRGKTDSQPSDPPHQPQMMAGSEKTRWVCSDAKDLKGEEGKDGRWGEEEKSNDSRTNLGQDSGTGFLPPSGSHQVFERWIEADKAIPLKKRRGSFVRKLSQEITVTEKAKTTKTKAKMKQQNDDEKEERENKERKRGGVIMEGSRCSRVNGRGWRCCQQTLVGYALCEHHLGKGRLRNITRIAPQKCKSQPLLVSPPLVERKQEEKMLLDDSYGGGEEEEEEEVVVVTKKRMKIGMVKARSISSLLGQTNNAEL